MCLSLEDYKLSLAAISLCPGDGIRLNCPGCSKAFWLRLPDEPIRYFADEIAFACASACGFYGKLEAFAPKKQDEPIDFDLSVHCGRCELDFAGDGAVLRRPCCFIETPRELMRDFVISVYMHEAEGANRQSLESMLERLVATFDGLMRRMLEIANLNLAGLSTSSQAYQLPSSSSFQNLAGARNRLLPAGFDMAAVAKDWTQLTRLFQKRHVIAHRLGVADEEYVAKTGDSSAVPGKKIPLSISEIKEGSEDCLRIVSSFFGMFLS